MFSYPEYSEKRQQREPRTLVPTHLLTNLHAHARKSGFRFFDKEAFICVSETNDKLLSRAIVEHILDQHNAGIVKRVFCKHVEHIMESIGDYNETEFLQIVRQWDKACDKRGIHPNECVNRWITMHKFLTKDVNFDEYPPLSTHIKGIPIVTYEGIIQGISTRILLYKLTRNLTFNNRAISTLAIESFFASLSKADFTMMGCPKATQIHRILPIMMQYNSYKHDPDKKFHMDSRQAAPYPHYDLERKMSIPEPSQCDDIQFKSHRFDMYCQTMKKRFKVNPTVGGIQNTK